MTYKCRIKRDDRSCLADIEPVGSISVWCNGNTLGFHPRVPGSTPGIDY